MAALDEILTDMDGGGSCSSLRMFRLLQGDVGSGKTAVAFLAMLKAAGQGAQSCMLAPTEVLTVQHWQVRMHVMRLVLCSSCILCAVVFPVLLYFSLEIGWVLLLLYPYPSAHSPRLCLSHGGLEAAGAEERRSSFRLDLTHHHLLRTPSFCSARYWLFSLHRSSSRATVVLACA